MRVITCQCPRILKDRCGIGEVDAMLALVRASFARVPLERHYVSVCTIVHTSTTDDSCDRRLRELFGGGVPQARPNVSGLSGGRSPAALRPIRIRNVDAGRCTQNTTRPGTLGRNLAATSTDGLFGDQAARDMPADKRFSLQPVRIALKQFGLPIGACVSQVDVNHIGGGIDG